MRTHPVSKIQLFALVLTSLLASSPLPATASAAVTPALTQEAGGDGLEADEQLIQREVGLFHDASISLGQAIAIAQKLYAGSRIADIAFDGGSGHPIYRVRVLQNGQVLERTIDARTGDLSGTQIVSTVRKLSAEDRNNLAALAAVRQELSDAVAVAERAGAGKAISGGLMNKRGRLNFVIVIVSGNQLKQVELEPPKIRGR